MKSLEITADIRSIVEEVSEFIPRHGCENYFLKQAGNPTLLIKEEFDRLFGAGEFSDGPYSESFGDGMGEPYNPNRQAFGRLNDGKLVYCELSKANQEKVKSYLERITE